jgi:hypothetical protein
MGEVRSRPPRTAATMPARSSRSAPPARSAQTIALSPGSSPMPARKRFANATSCAWVASTPMRSTSSSAGVVPTQENHAGEVSSRRALDASRSGGPK